MVTADICALSAGLFTCGDLKRILGVSERTLRRWREAKRIPRAVYLWLLYARGELGQHHHHWEGWRINLRTGELIAPNGIAVTASQIAHLNMAFNERDLLRSDNRELRKRLGGMIERQELKPARIIPFPGGRTRGG